MIIKKYGKDTQTKNKTSNGVEKYLHNIEQRVDISNRQSFYKLMRKNKLLNRKSSKVYKHVSGQRLHENV